ncbi:carbohydrate sulfotransferase 4-like isoform X2 [Orbicella faveolata]|uniref:carbohydrate sulfotransferase 4-like isoform X2 n=1 Tax=Orbicella faveolata TaxID=48498 RepID=UPI0009E4A6AC|nr:carbohydrate sulfotransferase 4-like isoform X2 [Orbicella faveolata]
MVRRQNLKCVADPTGPHLQGDNIYYDDSTTTLMPPQSRKRHVLLIVAHGRSGSTFLADIFNKHPRVFYVFEPLHDFQKHNRDRSDYDEFARNFLVHIFQCDFSVGNSTRDIGRFYRFKSRVLSSPPFCKYKQDDPSWNWYYCLPVKQKDLEQSCRGHDTTVYKLLLERIPGQSIEKLFEVCEVAGIECKVIHLIRDIRPLVMSSQKVAFFKEIDSREKPSMKRFVYSRCEMTERNLNLMKEFRSFLRSRVTLVRFEDLAVEPLRVLDYFYEFAGLEVLENITNWVVKITQPSLKDLKAEGRRAVSVIRNSLEVLNKWRLVADPCYVHVIERYCRDVMKLMGYISTEGSVEMLRNLKIPLFTEIYQAQSR